MARLIPEAGEAELTTWRSQAEASVYRAFRDLRNALVVIRGLNTLVPGPSGIPRDGEADFLVLDPARGLLVIEVKGGGVSFDSGSGIWSSRDGSGAVHTIKDPIAQAKSRKYDIVQILKANPDFSRLNIDFLFGHAALFPDIDDVRPLVRPDAPIDLLGGRKELNDLGRWLSAVFSFWKGGFPKGKDFGPNGVAAAEKVLCKSFSVQPKLAARIQQAEDAQAYWTSEQCNALRGMRTWKKIAVSGGAGTGKTILAVRRAQELAASGKKTLLLCYNTALADCLNLENQAFIGSGAATRETLHTFGFHQFCGWWIDIASKRSGRDLLHEAEAAYPSGNRYDIHLPIALGFALEVVEPEYEAIIIDEAQDMGDEYWLPISIMADAATMAVFYDPNQALFRLSREFPFKPDEAYQLTRNCRNTDAVHEAAYRYYRGPRVDSLGIPGTPPGRWMESDRARQAKRIVSELHTLIHVEKVRPEQIAILILDSFTKASAYDELRRAAQARHLPLVEESLASPGQVVLDTVGRFKGLEASVVVVWLNSHVDAEWQRHELYVALSRPSSVLVLAGTEEDCAAVSAGLTDIHIP